MKTLCLFLCSLVHYSLLAQISFENTYTDGSINRVNLASSGEKYYLLDVPNTQVKIYSSDHTSWKTINLSIPTGTTIDGISISENKVNTDNLVEVVYTVSNFSTGFKESYIVNELGTILLSVPNASALFVNEVAGLPNKIIAHISASQMTSNVYEANLLTLENTYLGGHVDRVNLSISGEKYYLFAFQSSQVKIYNSNHTLWKSINLFIPTTTRIRSLAISETKINTDNLVEVSYSFASIISPYNNESQIVNELETILLSVPDATALFVNEIPGLPNKIIAYLLGTQAISKTYGVPSLTLEGTYTGGYIRRVNLPSFGEKYYLFSSQHIQAKIYNSDHTFWKGINLPIPNQPTPLPPTIREISSVSENVINSDTLLEIGYTVVFPWGVVGLLDEYESYIINELGTTLISIPNARSIAINEIPSFQNKIIAQINDSLMTSSEVYGLPTISIAIQKLKRSISLEIYPNPTQDYLTIKKGGFDIREAMVVSLEGRLVQNIELSEQNTRIDLRQLKSGIYFITGEDKEGKTFCEKIRKE
ncbi:MAG: hypothetical protein ACI976_002486 [Aureispira sp.]|jgi:hypothetical protein